jgi:hypothetical protein
MMASKVNQDGHENKRQRTQEQEDEWQWHILLTRSRVVIEADDPTSIVSVDEHARNDSLGWNLTIVRMKSSEHDETEIRNATSIPPCPWLRDEKPNDTNDDASSLFAYDRLDADALMSNDQPVKNLLPVLPSWPLGTSAFFMSRMRILLHWKELVCNVGDPINLLKQALKTMCAANSDDTDKKDGEDRLMDDLSAFGHSPEDLLAARRQLPSVIIVHAPSEVLQQQKQEIQDAVRNAFPTVQQVDVSGPCTQLSSDLMERILWTLDFHNHVEFRWALKYNCQRSSPHDKSRGRLNHESEDFWGCGVPLKTMDATTRQRLIQSYQAATKLVAARPWSHWKSFELLKVTVLDAANKELDTKWLMFSSDDCHEAWSLTRSPYGFMQIMNDLSERDRMPVYCVCIIMPERASRFNLLEYSTLFFRLIAARDGAYFNKVGTSKGSRQVVAIQPQCVCCQRRAKGNCE